jgi:Flp pilus assembly protein TadG
MMPAMINRLKAKLRLARERGDAAVAFVLLVPVLILVVGLVVDGAGQIKASEQATTIAQGAARAGANGGVSAKLPSSGAANISAGQAINAANQYLAASGITGNVEVNGRTVTVTAHKDYKTKFLSMFVGTLTGKGTGSAQLLSGP